MRMRLRGWVTCCALSFTCMPAAFAVSSVERVKNDKVVVTEVTLAPGESAGPLPGTDAYPDGVHDGCDGIEVDEPGGQVRHGGGAM